MPTVFSAWDRSSPFILRDNWQAFEALNLRAGHQPLLDPLMVFGAQDLIMLAPLLLLALWLASARWSFLGRNQRHAASDLERGWLNEDRRLGQQISVLGVVGVFFALALNFLLGHAVLEPRPFVSYPAQVHLLIAHATDNSFPSDHTAVIAAVTTALGLYLLLMLRGAVHLSAKAWLDSNDLGAGNFQQRINDALDKCEWFLLVLTHNALASK